MIILFKLMPHSLRQKGPPGKFLNKKLFTNLFHVILSTSRLSSSEWECNSSKKTKHWHISHTQYVTILCLQHHSKLLWYAMSFQLFRALLFLFLRLLQLSGDFKKSFHKLQINSFFKHFHISHLVGRVSLGFSKKQKTCSMIPFSYLFLSSSLMFFFRILQPSSNDFMTFRLAEHTWRPRKKKLDDGKNLF